MKNTIKWFVIIALVAVIGLGTAACASMIIVSVEEDTVEAPAQVRQYMDIAKKDVTIYGNYKDGSRRKTNAGILKYDASNPGPITVACSSGNINYTFQTEVMPLTGIRIASPPTQLEYLQGFELNRDGLRVMGMWEGLPDAELNLSDSHVLVGSLVQFAPGVQTVTVTYHNKTATFEVTVKPRPHPIHGTWEKFYPVGDNEMRDTFTFNADGTFEAASYNTTQGLGGVMLSGTYTVSGNTLTLTAQIGAPQTQTFSVNGNELTLTSGDRSSVLTKAQ